MISIGIILAIIAELRYIYTVVSGSSKPNFSAWGIFTVSMFLVLVSSYALGARESLAIVTIFTFLHFLTTVLAYRYKQFKLSRFEKVLLALVLLSIVLWIVTSNPWTALGINILIDTFGFIALIRKLYLYPGTEDVSAWLISLFAYVINIFSLHTWSLEEYLFSLSNIFWISIVTMLTLKKPLK